MTRPNSRILSLGMPTSPRATIDITGTISSISSTDREYPRYSWLATACIRRTARGADVRLAKQEREKDKALPPRYLKGFM